MYFLGLLGQLIPCLQAPMDMFDFFCQESMERPILVEVSFDLKEFQFIYCQIQESSFLALVFVNHLRDSHASGSMLLFESAFPIYLELINNFLDDLSILYFDLDFIQIAEEVLLGQIFHLHVGNVFIPSFDEHFLLFYPIVLYDIKTFSLF